jgi:hypothetical protein
LLLGTACDNGLKNKEKVQEAILTRLQAHSGLDLNSVDVNTTDVSFEKNRAFATVIFHAKSDPAVNSGMSMKYTLEARDGKWVVVNVADSQGHSMTGPSQPAGGQLPAGHPALDSTTPLVDPSGPAETK